jgi:ribose transport system permease protein
MRLGRFRLSFGLDRFSGLYLAAAFIAVFGIWTPGTFLTGSTLHSVADGQAVTAMLGIAVLIPLATGVFDLSVGSTVNITAVVVTILQTRDGQSIGVSIAVAVAIGILVGLINGFLVVVLHLNSFIATLGMATVIEAVQEIISAESQPLPPDSSAWLSMTQHQVFGFQVVFFYMILLALIAWWVMSFTPAGRYMFAVGGNAEAARLSGIRVGKWTWWSLIASGTIAGVAGVFYASLNGPSLTFGAGLLLPAFAAAFLGSTQLTPGRFNVWGTVLAVYVLAIGVKGLQLVSGVQWANDMFNGVALIVAVAFAVWRQRRAASGDREAVPVTAEQAAPAAAQEDTVQEGLAPGVPPPQAKAEPAPREPRHAR